MKKTDEQKRAIKESLEKMHTAATKKARKKLATICAMSIIQAFIFQFPYEGMGLKLIISSIIFCLTLIVNLGLIEYVLE